MTDCGDKSACRQSIAEEKYGKIFTRLPVVGLLMIQKVIFMGNVADSHYQ